MLSLTRKQGHNSKDEILEDGIRNRVLCKDGCITLCYQPKLQFLVLVEAEIQSSNLELLFITIFKTR